MLVLCKGGDNLSITSFGFFNRNVTNTIPLDSVSTFLKKIILVYNKIKTKITTTLFIIDLYHIFIGTLYYFSIYLEQLCYSSFIFFL